MKTIKFKMVLTVVVSTLLLGGCTAPSKPTPPEAVNGVLDLSGWDFERNGPVELKGQWLFGAFKDAGTQYPVDSSALSEKVFVPGSWTAPGFLGERSLEPFGFASYALTVKLPEVLPERLGVQLGSIYTSGDLQIWGASTNQYRKLDKGRFCQQASECRYQNSYEDFAELWTNIESEVTIVLRVSNWAHGTRGGVYQAPVLSDFSKTSDSMMWSYWLSAVVIGVLATIWVYFLCLFISRPDDLGVLYFSGICFATGLREFLISGTLARFGIETSSFGYNVQISLEYAAMPLLAYLGVAYVIEFFDAREKLSNYLRWIKFISIGLGAFAVIAPTDLVTQSLVVFQIELAAMLFTVLPATGYFALKGRPFGKAFLLSAAVISVGTTNDILHAADVIHTGFYSHLFLMVFVLMQSVFLASKFTRAMDERDAKNQELLSTYQQLDEELMRRESLEASNAQLELENQAAAQQLIQADKLATLGTLVAGVAHDIANPTGLIVGSVALMNESRETLRIGLDELLDDGTSAEAMALKAEFMDVLNDLDTESANIRLGAHRINAINSAIRNQARSDHAPSMENLRALIDECLTVVGHRLTGIEVEVRCPEVLIAKVIRSQFGQVLMNLLSNAADAISEHEGNVSGRIVIEIESLENHQFGINIDDNGPGVPLEIRDKILEPFFTTKEVGKGTGLGMPIVLRILEAHGMCLTIEDAPELGGARFRMAPIE